MISMDGSSVQDEIIVTGRTIVSQLLLFLKPSRTLYSAKYNRSGNHARKCRSAHPFSVFNGSLPLYATGEPARGVPDYGHPSSRFSGCIKRETAIEYGEWMCRSAFASMIT